MPAPSDVEQGAPPAAEFPRSLETIQSELAKLMDDLTPKLQQLAAMKDSYSARRDIKKSAVEREKLLSDIRPMIDKFVESEEEFNKLRQTQDTMRLVAAVGSMMGGRGIPVEAGNDLAQSQTRMNFSRDIRTFREGAWTTISSEDTSFKAAEKTYKMQQLWFIATSILLCLLALAVGF
ncbi:MAG: hypothetical protein WCI75_20240, partial [candidate division NC10 bacterium]